MFLRATTRKKDGEEHRYWSVVESRRVAGGRVAQRHVLYLGEINSSQELAWRKSIEVLEDGEPAPRTYALFPEDRCEGSLPDESIVRLKLKAMRFHRPRQWGACWLALHLWHTLDLDVFWAERLPASRKGTHWDLVLFVLAAYRLIAPGSEWRLHREWYGRTALADLLGSDERLADPRVLYECHDRLLAHKEALFTHLTGRWRDLFNATFEVLLYDLTSTYFESDPPLDENDKRRHGYSRDHRFDCVQIVIALIVTPEGLPLAYEILPGNTSDSTTLRSFLAKIEHQYGKAQRIWCMDRGVPTEEILAEMRRSEPPVQYLVGTPKGRLNRLEQSLLMKPWHQARAGVKVKLLPEDGELYVFAESADRIAKERSMRRRQLKWLWARLAHLCAYPDHRRSRAPAHPLHPTRARTGAAARALAAHPSRPTAPKNQRRPERLRAPLVVKTLAGAPKRINHLPSAKPRIREVRLRCGARALTKRLPVVSPSVCARSGLLGTARPERGRFASLPHAGLP
jgi:hypothetical protein